MIKLPSSADVFSRPIIIILETKLNLRTKRTLCSNFELKIISNSQSSKHIKTKLAHHTHIYKERTFIDKQNEKVQSHPQKPSTSLSTKHASLVIFHLTTTSHLTKRQADTSRLFTCAAVSFYWLLIWLKLRNNQEYW